MKHLEENAGKTFSDINHTNIWSVSQGKRNQSKKKQMGPNQKKLSHSKRNYKQKEKTTYELGENIGK